MSKDYCSGFPEKWRGKDIHECCKSHDNDCGEAGDWKFFIQQRRFYNCLKSKGISIKWCTIITAGGSIGCAIKYPMLAWYKIKKRYFYNTLDGY
jgi:hypothetical protein